MVDGVGCSDRALGHPVVDSLACTLKQVQDSSGGFASVISAALAKLNERGQTSEQTTHRDGVVSRGAISVVS